MLTAERSLRSESALFPAAWGLSTASGGGAGCGRGLSQSLVKPSPCGRERYRHATHRARAKTRCPPYNPRAVAIAGWLPQNRWLGEFDYSDNLFIKNPKNGLIANTNNQTTSQPFPNHLSYAWGDTQRIRRLIDLMGGREIHTRSSFVETQLDSVSEAARGLLPLIAKELWFSTTIAEPNTPEALRQRAIDLLAEWNAR